MFTFYSRLQGESVVTKRDCSVGAVKNMRAQKRCSENSTKIDVKSWFAVADWSVIRPTIIGSVLLLAGCASVPDVVNPVEWYKDVKGVVTGDKSAASTSDGKTENRLAADRNEPAPGANEPTPSLSTVPQRPKTSSRAERQRIKQGLVSERNDSRQYSNNVIRRQGESASSLRAPAPRAAPAPAPVPASQANTKAPGTSSAKPMEAKP